MKIKHTILYLLQGTIRVYIYISGALLKTFPDHHLSILVARYLLIYAGTGIFLIPVQGIHKVKGCTVLCVSLPTFRTIYRRPQQVYSLAPVCEGACNDGQ